MKNKLFINIYDFEREETPFQIFIGGRGTGKTYSALKGIMDGRKIILMRRTDEELEMLYDSNEEGGNPFKTLNTDFGTNYGIKPIVKHLAGIYHREMDEEGKLIHVGQPLGYCVALTTISKLRGVDFSDCTDLVYDEFIPEKHVRRIKGEAHAFFNGVETIARNREFLGRPPLKVWLLANAFNIYNPICEELGIVNNLERMKKSEKEHSYMIDRALAIHLLRDNPDFVEKKKETALYKLTKGSSFYDMALHNDFAYNDFTMISHKKLAGYVPVCSLGDAYIYKKKGSKEYYITYAQAKCPHFDGNTEQDLMRFKKTYRRMFENLFMRENLTFESYELKERFLNVIL